MSGAPLSRSLEFEFTTVSVADRSGGWDVFVDHSPNHGKPLRPAFGRKNGDALEIGPLDAIEFEGDEPLDPSTLVDENFELLPTGDAASEPIALRALLVENDDKGAWPGRGKTRLRLVPNQPLQSGSYLLRTHQGKRTLRDFGGNWVPVVDDRGRLPGRFKIEVVEGVKTLPWPGSYKEEFLTADMLSPGVVQGVDGAAHWSGSGRVEIRYPAAAGSGIDGDVRLRQPVRRNTIEAARLEIPSNEWVELDPEPGLVVLSSQSELRVAGTLARDAEGTALQAPEAQTLTAWLAEARRKKLNCTVLIAGGDLVISGEIQVAGPLVADCGRQTSSLGSRDRRRGQGSFHAHCLYRSWERRGGGGLVQGLQEGRRGGRLQPREVQLILDPPHTNPLRVPLRFGVRSRRIPQSGIVARWRPGPKVSGHQGGGVYRVRYVGQGMGPNAIEQVRDDPSLLLDCPTLKLEIELDIRPNLGMDWDPPWVDSVELSWDQPETPR